MGNLAKTTMDYSQVDKYMGEYLDTNPKHPGCPRNISPDMMSPEEPDVLKVTVQGHDGKEWNTWECPGKLAMNADGVLTITVDLSSKGGPADLEGIWVQAPGKAEGIVAGINWIRDGDTVLPVKENPTPADWDKDW